MGSSGFEWTNASVRAMAQGEDPTGEVIRRAREFVLDAIEEGWSGPPFDPLDLARRKGIEVVPTEEVLDARLLSTSGGARIEFNPNRPRIRTRFSLSHEIAHTLFPDWKDASRYRTTREERGVSDDWQLELLCNLAASEILMPIGSLSAKDDLSFDGLLQWSKEFDVSAEAAFLRAVRILAEPAAVLTASSVDPNSNERRYRIDYVVPTSDWDPPGLTAGTRVSGGSVLSECTAVGFTAKGQLKSGASTVGVSCLAIPPYPGHRFPRVLALAKPTRGHPRKRLQTFTYLYGDATAPRGSGLRMVAFVVNDKTPRWGGGFAQQVKLRWPEVQAQFISATRKRSDVLKLGSLFTAPASKDITAAAIVAQRGYGASVKPRIRYIALRDALLKLAQEALAQGATVHMPRIGAGQARGSWQVIEGLIAETLTAKGVQVTIYDPPGSQPPPSDNRPRLFG
ncbi:MAG TPA: ImmA/IrrE family metallo-endopeptidase [Actinomycetota bacterium]